VPTAKAYAAHSPTSDLVPFTFERREPGPHDVQIDVLYCGICHSDLHQARNDWRGSIYPMVPGHEIVGRVTRVGAVNCGNSAIDSFSLWLRIAAGSLNTRAPSIFSPIVLPVTVNESLLISPGILEISLMMVLMPPTASTSFWNEPKSTMTTWLIWRPEPRRAFTVWTASAGPPRVSRRSSRPPWISRWSRPRPACACWPLCGKAPPRVVRMHGLSVPFYCVALSPALQARMKFPCYSK